MKTDHAFIGLDHLRALAISLVFLFHYTIFQHPEWMNNSFIHFGWSGVDLFFVLSGFLISNQLMIAWQKRQQIPFREFYIKRIFRTFPPYFFVLLIYIFIPAFHERETLAPLWKMFTFTQNYGQDIRRYGTFSHAWSLCVEEQFYLLLPLILMWVLSFRLKKKSGWVIPAIFLLTILFRWITWLIFLKPTVDSDDFGMEWYRLIYYPTYTRLDGLMVGVGIAALYRFRESWLVTVNRYANPMIIGGFILFVLSLFLCLDQHAAAATIFGFSLIAIAFGFLVLSSVLPGSLLYRTKSVFTENIATLSYSLYLSHKGIIHLTQKWFTGLGIPGDSNWMLLICIITCIGGALLMRIFIEKPFFRMRNKLLETVRTVAMHPDVPAA
jgi:peptidoglycan/LPS O-acetylase OafA/YrhL